jgi:hypothetical protein
MIRIASPVIVLAFLLLAFLPQKSFAQADSVSHRLEIGIGIPSIRATVYGDLWPSISIKRKWNKNAIRTGIIFPSPPYGSRYGYLVNLGYERILFGNRFQMFAGVDLGYEKIIYRN